MATVSKQECTQALADIHKRLEALDSLSLEELNPRKTVLIVVDMTYPVGKLVSTIADLARRCRQQGIEIVSCEDGKAGVSNSRLVQEIASAGIDRVFFKKCFNGFLAPGFLDWLDMKAEELENIIVVGMSTDFCVMQLALTLKAYYNQSGSSFNVVVPINAVDTFEAVGHSRNLANSMALYFMLESGIKVVSSID